MCKKSNEMCLVCLTWFFCPLYLSCTTNLLNIFLRQHQTYILVYLTKLNGQSLCKADLTLQKVMFKDAVINK